jgi:DNA-directed RNA polymerase specialized sigma24 family protein
VPETDEPKNEYRWPQTIWENLDALRNATPQDRHAILCTLITAYEHPVLEYLFGLGFSDADAKDVAQQFFINVVDRRRLLDRAERSVGMLRNFIRIAVRQFASNFRRDAGAQIRGGNFQHENLDDVSEELASEGAPDESFDRAWANSVVARTELRMSAEYAARGGAALWETLRPNLERWCSEESQPEAATRIGTTPAALAMELHRARKRYAHILRNIVSETAANLHETEDDLRYLRRLLSA